MTIQPLGCYNTFMNTVKIKGVTYEILQKTPFETSKGKFPGVFTLVVARPAGKRVYIATQHEDGYIREAISMKGFGITRSNYK